MNVRSFEIINKRALRNVAALLSLLFVAAFTLAQTRTSGSLQKSVPRLVKYSGSVRDAQGNPRTGVVGVMFSIYPEQLGSAALWSETQNVSLDSQGRYTVLLGSEHAEGLSMDLFASGEGRWLGVQVISPGEPEQSRVLLVSVPYAMKAGDSETLGGLPASAFLLAPVSPNASGKKGSAGSSRAIREQTSPTLGSPAAVMTTGGTAGQLSKFSDASTIVDSIVTELNGNIGIGTTTPDSTLMVVGSGDAKPLWHAKKDFIGDLAQYGNLLFFEGNLAFTADGSPGAQAFALDLFIPASNTFHVQKMISQGLFAENDGTGTVDVITGTESDVLTTAGSSTFVEGMDFSAENAGATVTTLRGGATSADATAGTTTNLIGFQIRTNSIGAGSTVTNNYGLSIASQAGGANTRALKTAGGIVEFGDKTLLAPSTATAASLNIPAGTAPSAPLPGDVWNDGTNLLIKSAGATKTLAFTDSALTGSGSGLTGITAANISAGTAAINVSGNSTTATALAANGSNCAAGSYAAGVSANGSAEGCSTDGSSFTTLNATQLTSGTVPDARISGNYSSGVALSNSGNTFIGTTASLGMGVAGAAVSGLNIANVAGANGVLGTTQSTTQVSAGVYGLATQAQGFGGVFRNSSADANFALVVRNAADNLTTFSVKGDGNISGRGTFITNLNAGNLNGTVPGPTLSGVVVSRSTSGIAFGATNTLDAANQHGLVGTTQSNTAESYGVFGVATQANGVGGAFKNSAGDTNTALEVRNAADSATNFSVTGAGAVTIGSGGAAIKAHRSVVASIDFAGATLANQNCIDKAFGFTGAADGDAVNFGVPSSLGNLGTLQWSGFVSAANTVLFRICNNGGSPIVLPGAVSIRADVWQH